MLYGNFVVKRDPVVTKAVFLLMDLAGWDWSFARNIVNWRKEHRLPLFPTRVI